MSMGRCAIAARANADGRLFQCHKQPIQQRYQKVALLVSDELGFVPFKHAGSELLLFNSLAQCYAAARPLLPPIWHSPSGSKCSAPKN